RPALRSRLEPVEEGEARGVERTEPALEHFAHQRFLGPEVIVDRGEIHPGARGYLAQRGDRVAVLHEQRLRRGEDAVAGGAKTGRGAGHVDGAETAMPGFKQPIQTSV